MTFSKITLTRKRNRKCCIYIYIYTNAVFSKWHWEKCHQNCKNYKDL